jgi:MFS family permease
MSGEVFERRPILALAAGIFLVETGAFGIIPVLPLYLRGRGISYSTVGLLVGVTLLVAFLFTYPSGRLGDVLGRRPLVVAGAALYGFAGLALLLPLSIPVLLLARVAQGLGVAAILPSANAMVADLAPPSHRGKAYSWISAATLGGLTVGPAIGGALTLVSLNAVFIFSAASGLLAAALLRLALPAPQPRVEIDPSVDQGRGEVPRRNVAAALLAAGGVAILFGSYETVWPLFMHHVGAADWQVGLSFTLFGLPYVVVTPIAGWAADRYDRRILALAGYGAACGWALVYPSLTSIPLLMGLGMFEAVGVAFAQPAYNAQVMHGVPEHRRGRIQGLVTSLQTGGQATGALLSGALFGLGFAIPFYFGAAVGLCSLAASAILFFGARKGSSSPGLLPPPAP